MVAVVFTLFHLWAALSGLALVALGLSLARLRPRRGPTLLFAAFCAAWGAQVVAATATRSLESVVLGRVNLAFGVPTYLFLVHFVTVFPNRARSPLAGTGVGLFLAVAVAAVAAFLVAPASLLERLVPTPDGAAPVYGDLALPLVIAPFFLAFDFAAVWLLRVHERAKGATRQQARLLLAGVLLFVSYSSVQNLAPFAISPGLVAALGPRGLGFAALFGFGALLTAGIALRLLRRRGLEGLDPLLMGSAVVPGLVAALEGALIALGLARFDTLGLWRIGTVALVAYAIAKYQLFDLDVRLRVLSIRALPGAAALVGAAVGLTAFEGAGLTPAIVAAVAVGAPAGLAAHRGRGALAQRLFPAEPDDPAYLYHRKLEVYRATLERVVAEGQPAGEEPQLRALRKSLGLSEREAQVLEYVVRRGLGTPGQAGEGAPRVEPGALLLGRYRVERLLGEGAHGRAYLARDEKLGREVVVKAVGTSVLGGRAAQLLVREARLAGSLKHPNIVAVHDVAETPHEAIIVMEYCDGGSLHGLLRRRGRLGLAEATSLFDQVLAGLEAAHAKGIVHRDIKPENILLMRDGTVKLADFGVAREERPEATGITQGGAMGTLLYMSPEQVRGLAVDGRSDLYAAAVVFHQALTGRFYLRVAGKDDFQVRQLILRGAPQLPPEPAWVRELLQRALAKEPGKRWPSAAAMRAGLPRLAAEKAA